MRPDLSATYGKVASQPEHLATWVRSKWKINGVDFGMAANGVYDYKNFIFTGKIQYIHANNYQYQYEEKPELENFWRYETFNKTNWHLQLGAMYRF
ncbi:hypothetical protein [Olivibacter domesticus]|uniref:hypothetical protein n=1 Tax=Olivibacter domesticus TaxID=407022 RepID=UPI000B804A81|nr:hypothetical protein [Olivibacter domesticus]